MLEIENKKYEVVKFEDLLKEEIYVPNEQRLLDKDRVDEIVKYQENYHKKNKRFNFQGVLNIHYCKETNRQYLVDGQHRFNSIKKLVNSNYVNNKIVVERVNVETYEELKENYLIINKNDPLPEYPEGINKDIPENVFKHFEEKYPKIWSKSKRPNRPNLNKNHFQEALGYLTDKLKKSKSELIEIIEIKNDKISKWDIDDFSQIKRLKNKEKIIEKCKENNFYLGMYHHISEDYAYEWISRIIEEETGIIPEKQKKEKSKKKIPKKIKNNTWNKYIGKEHGEGLCYVCRETNIDKAEFVCGHVKSEKNGGEISVDNLRPICSSCNSSMGIIHMREYIELYHKKNLKDFDNNVLSLIKKEKVGLLSSIFS